MSQCPCAPIGHWGGVLWRCTFTYPPLPTPLDIVPPLHPPLLFSHLEQMLNSTLHPGQRSGTQPHCDLASACQYASKVRLGEAKSHWWCGRKPSAHDFISASVCVTPALVPVKIRAENRFLTFVPRVKMMIDVCFCDRCLIGEVHFKWNETWSLGQVAPELFRYPLFIYMSF